MFPRALPLCILAALASMPFSALAVAYTPDHPQLWRAALALALLSWITPLIIAVNVRIIPVFSRRSWRWPRLALCTVIGSLLGGWLAAVGIATKQVTIERSGHLLTLAAGVAFAISLVTLFRQPAARGATPVPMPPADPLQSSVDKHATPFMRHGLVFLLSGLVVGAVGSFWTPETGRWPLVWAHLLLVGWMLHSVSGVLYHAASRWTGVAWRSLRLIALHRRLAPLATWLMVAALASDQRVLFAVGGSLQAVALGLLAWNVLPVLQRMPQPSRAALYVAFGTLALGVSLGVSFAFVDSLGATHRITHATLNVFGFTGLLIFGVASYLLPRFFGYPLRWPRLVRLAIGLQAGAVLALAAGWAMYTNSTSHATTVITSSALLVALAGALFVACLAGTVHAGLRHRIATVPMATPMLPQRSR